MLTIKKTSVQNICYILQCQVATKLDTCNNRLILEFAPNLYPRYLKDTDIKRIKCIWATVNTEFSHTRNRLGIYGNNSKI